MYFYFKADLCHHLIEQNPCIMWHKNCPLAAKCWPWYFGTVVVNCLGINWNRTCLSFFALLFFLFKFFEPIGIYCGEKGTNIRDQGTKELRTEVPVKETRSPSKTAPPKEASDDSKSPALRPHFCRSSNTILLIHRRVTKV